MPLADHNFALSRERLSGVFLERGLGIERIDVADSPAHEQVNAALGARRKGGLLWRVWIEADGLGVARRIVGRRRQQPVLIQQMRQSQTADAAAGFKQEIASRPESLHRPNLLTLTSG